jgi:cell division septation protein DedD
MDTQLKQRLIGGAVLVALAVIFLPMLVQGPAPDSGVADVSTRVPDAPGGDYETRELPLGPEAATAAGQSALPAPEAAEPAQPAASSSAQESTATAAQPDPAVAAGQWAVTFGAYAGERDAQAVLSRLRQAGLPGFIEQDTINGRQAWRVRVGPYADRALAEAGRLQAVRIRSDVNAQVIALDAGGDNAAAAPAPAPVSTPAVAASASQATAVPSTPAVRTEPLPSEPAPARPAAAAAATPKTAPAPKPPASTPPAPAPASAPAASSVGFAVQMGAFASAAEANAMRDRLRAGGFSAIVQPVRTDKGTLNRVRVGPVSSRAEAEQLKARLAGGFGAGMVVPHP